MAVTRTLFILFTNSFLKGNYKEKKRIMNEDPLGIHL
jgi:hypothetical protein